MGQSIIDHTKIGQVSQAADVGGYRSRQRIVIDAQMLQADEGGDLCRQGAGELIISQR